MEAPCHKLFLKIQEGKQNVSEDRRNKIFKYLHGLELVVRMHCFYAQYLRESMTTYLLLIVGS